MLTTTSMFLRMIKQYTFLPLFAIFERKVAYDVSFISEIESDGNLERNHDNVNCVKLLMMSFQFY